MQLFSPRSAVRGLVAVAVAAVLPSVAVATPAHAANRGHTLAAFELMDIGDYLTRTVEVNGVNHRVRLIMQADSNLVLYKNHGGVGGTTVACGASKSNRYPNVRAYMDANTGVFYAYDRSLAVRWTTAPYTNGWGDKVAVNFINGQAVATVYDRTENRAFNFWKC
jgi:hypothetical protein